MASFAKQLSTTEHLALLHTATALACFSNWLDASSHARNGRSGAWLFLLVAITCGGYLVLIFLIGKRERTAKGNEKLATTEKKREDFGLTISDVRTNPHNGKVEYRVDGTYNDEQWSAWLRYSTLRQLKGRVGQRADDAFPGKTSVTQWVAGSDSAISFVDERRKALNRFLKEAVPTKEAFEILAQVDQVRTALGVPSSLQISAGAAAFKMETAVKVALEALDMTVEIAKFGDKGGNGWELFQSSNDGIKAFMKKEGDFTYAMSSGPMDVNKRRAMEFIVDFEHRKMWDELFKANDILEMFVAYDSNFSYPPTEDPFNTKRSQDWEILGLNVARTTFGSPAKAFVAERDSVCVGVLARRRSDGAMCVALKSVEHPKAPEGLEGYVRAKVIVAGFVFEDRKDGKPGCTLTTMGLVDPNGAIPQFVINQVAKLRAFVLRDINRACMSVI